MDKRDTGKESGSNSHIIDIEEPYISLAKSMEASLEKLPTLSSKRCIYRVPPKLRKINEVAYTPLIVSIGPLHHGKVGLQAMEKQKRRYLQNFLRRTQKGLLDFVKKANEEEEEIRNCYAETIEFTSDEFVEMILVDVAFIIEVLWGSKYISMVEKNDPLFNNPWMIYDIICDLRLLENQLPFFVLNDLYNMANFQAFQPSFVDLTREYFKKTADKGFYLPETISSHANHLLDFQRKSLRPTKPRQPPKGTGGLDFIPCATKLNEAGVMFKTEKVSKNLFEVKFVEGVLQIPYLEIFDQTEGTLRNMVALEQCHYQQSYMSDYITFLDMLIDSPKDVELLARSGVIKHSLGNNEDVSNLFNKLSKEIGVNFKEYYLVEFMNN
ncbi:unnamed protein product [Ilex paraguariensis]|uniref:Uncharacterized protein n=1 Tax=Ilex paraguariensis TaxID=185542 RepID=A0ABC8UBJ7_9AQUA